MTAAPPPEPPEQPQFNLIASPEALAGVWANFARVNQSPYEFTIDFARIDFTTSQGVLVSRVSMSPLMVSQLIDALTRAFQRYTERAMPREVYEDGGDDTAGDGPPGAGTDD